MKSLKLLALFFILTVSLATLSALNSYEQLELAKSYQALSQLEPDKAKRHLANAIKYYHKAKTELTNTPDKYYNSIFYLAEIYHALSKLELDKAQEHLTNAIENYNQAKTELKPNENSINLAECSQALSQLESEKKEHKENAIKNYLQTLKAIESQEHPEDWRHYSTKCYLGLFRLEPENTEYFDKAKDLYLKLVKKEEQTCPRYIRNFMGKDSYVDHIFGLAEIYFALSELETETTQKDLYLSQAKKYYLEVATELEKWFPWKASTFVVSMAGLGYVCFKKFKEYRKKKAADNKTQISPVV